MAYLKIYADGTQKQIGEIRHIENQSVIFDMKGNKVGYYHIDESGSTIFDLNGKIVDKVEDLLIRE